MSFDVQTNMTHDEYLEKYPQAVELGELLQQKEPISFEDFKMIPGITKAKLSELHSKHLAALKP